VSGLFPTLWWCHLKDALPPQAGGSAHDRHRREKGDATSTPKTNATVLSTIDLAPEMPGHWLRLRNVVFEPGDVVGMHSHQARPAFSYILEGTLTVGQEGGDVREYTSGEVITESRDVTHWGENRGTSKVVIVSVDIITKP